MKLPLIYWVLLLCFFLTSCTNPIISNINQNELKKVDSTKEIINNENTSYETNSNENEIVEETCGDYFEKIESNLLEMYENSDVDFKIPVMIWLENLNLSNDKDTKENSIFANNYLCEDEIIYISQYTPVIIANISKEKVTQLIKLQNVTSISHFSSTVTPE